MWVNIRAIMQAYLREHDRGRVILLLGLALLVYAPFFGNPFVFDDVPFLSTAVAYYATIPFHFDLRWFPYATLGWTWAFFRESPYAYRIGNLALHATNGVLLFYFLRQLLSLYAAPAEQVTRITRAAWVGALFFVCHPVAIYATGYMVQRSTLMATLFVLVMLSTYLRGLTSGNRIWLVASVCAYFLAFFSKEHSVMAPAIAVLLSVMLASRIGVSRSALWVTLAAFAAVGVFGLLRVKGVIGVPYEMAFEDAGADSYFTQQGLSGLSSSLLHLLSILTQAEAYFRYLLLWWWPNPAWMSVDVRIPFVHSILDWRAWVATASFVAYGAGAVWLLLRRNGMALVGFALLYPWLMFLVEFSSIRVQEPFVLYRSYLWLPGMAFLFALLVAKLDGKKAAAITILLMIMFVPLAWNRLGTFSGAYRLWNDAAKQLKDGSVVGADRIYYNRGNASLSLKNWDMSITDYKRVVVNNPRIQPVYLNLGSAYYGAQRYSEALAAYEEAIKLNPKDAQAYLGKGLSLKRLNNDAAALEQISVGCGLGNVMACAIVASYKHSSAAGNGVRDIEK